MSRSSTQAPWEFLLSASHNTLQSYELSRLAHAANLRKEITELLNQWLEENASAMLARWLMEQRERSVLNAGAVASENAPAEAPGPNGPTASDNFFAEGIVPPRAMRNRR